MANFLAEAGELFEYSRALRRDLHRHPELGFQELRTSGVVANELNQLGLQATTGMAQTGVVALLEGARPGPTALLRFDMDALPINEETGAEYASQTPGVMHACGHDGHVAIGLTVARMLLAHREQLAGRVKFVFQPAEEGLGGAERMVAEGVLENPRPDIALALHIWNDKPFGWLGVTAGPAMAASEVFTIQVTGKGGHGAIPELAIDPVLAAAHIITAIQSIVSRNVSPLKTAVISVTSVKAGGAFNVIPSHVKMRGTIRTFEPDVRQTVMERLHQVVENTAAAYGCQAEVQVKTITPAVINDAELAGNVQRVAWELLPECQLDTEERTMGSEDMAFMMQEIPGCYFFVGSANAEKGLNFAHHHPKFDFDERVLPRAAALMAAATYDFLKG